MCHLLTSCCATAGDSDTSATIITSNTGTKTAFKGIVRIIDAAWDVPSLDASHGATSRGSSFTAASLRAACRAGNARQHARCCAHQ